MKIHVYMQKMQPATHFVDNCGSAPATAGYAPKSLVYCECCSRRRRAENCGVQVYYDCLKIFCADGKGCNNQREIERKARRIHNNRSRGQKRRWNKPNAQTSGPEKKP